MAASAPAAPAPAAAAANEGSAFGSSSGLPPRRKKPIVCIVLGMAGSGKTTLLHRLNLYLNEVGKKSYFLNLDPAVQEVPFSANIDIRDTVNYKEVMKQYGLGPNGGIITSLNLFATRFGQVLEILEKHADDLDYVFLDTPGQIEVFTWSSSGDIITGALAASFPTVLCYVVDTPRSQQPTTFMSNMLYACSVLYRSRLPVLVSFTKTDVAPAAFAREWMADFEKFQDAVEGSGDESYMSSLNRSLCLVLDEFYATLRTAEVSAVTGAGMPDYFKALGEAAAEFEALYVPELERRAAEARRVDEAAKQAQLNRLMADMAVDSEESGAGGSEGGAVAAAAAAARARRQPPQATSREELETHEV